MTLPAMQYAVVESGVLQDLWKIVNDMIAEGFVPQGGIAVDCQKGLNRYLQALIRINKENP